MLTCENCGTLFKQKPDAEVASSRILCADCTEKRRRDKEAAKRNAAGGAQKPQPTAAVAEPPKPKAAAPAPARAERPAAKRAEPEQRRGERAHRDDRAGNEGRRVPHRREPKPLLNTASKIGLVIALFVTLGCVGVWVYRNMKVAAQEKEAKDYKAKIDGFIKEMRALDMAKPSDAQTLIARYNADRELWSGTEISGEMSNLAARAKATLERDMEVSEIQKALLEVETLGRDAILQPLPALVEIRRKIDRLESKVGALPDGEARLKAIRKSVNQTYAQKLQSDAKGFATQNPTDDKGILEKYKNAEDEIRALLEKAANDKDAAAQSSFETIFQQTIAESDGYCKQFFTDAKIAAAPRRDLLADAVKQDWNCTDELAGFSHATNGGVMTLIGPDESKGQKVKAVMTVGDKEKWRDFVVDMVITRGAGTLLTGYRVGRNVDQTVPTFLIPDDSKFPADQAVHVTASMIGSKLLVKTEGNDVPLLDWDIPWTMQRRGAFGLIVPTGAQMRITKLEVRVLR